MKVSVPESATGQGGGAPETNYNPFNEANLNGWDNENNNFTPPLRKTPSTGDNMSNKNNESMNDSDKFFECDDEEATNQHLLMEDDDDGFVNYNQAPDQLQRK